MIQDSQKCYFIDWKTIEEQGFAPEWLQRKIHNDLASLSELDAESAKIFIEKRYDGRSIEFIKGLVK